MPAPKLRWDYDALMQIAQAFARQSDAAGKTLLKVARAKDTLQSGDWAGKGAKAFYTEMDQDVLPGVRRLSEALQTAQQVTLRMIQVLQGAEQDAARLLAMLLAGISLDGRVFETAQTALGHVGDFFIGMWDEGKDMVTGLYKLVTDPVGTAKGLWQGITHPKMLWEAFKGPYVEAWESGHPGQAIGRGVMFVGSILLGTKGADKIADMAKAARAARVTADAAEVGARTASVAEAATELGTVATGSRAEAAVARYIATQSTETTAGLERVVLGATEANPAKGFLGYVGEARTFGGTVYTTGDDLWGVIKQAGRERTWAVNREFMQSQLEAGVSKFELQGETVNDLLRLRPDSYAAREINFLQRYGYEYGYQQIGDSWVKTGGWRASTAGRAAGASVGPGLELIEDSSP